jgi:hypothetical protein
LDIPNPNLQIYYNSALNRFTQIFAEFFFPIAEKIREKSQSKSNKAKDRNRSYKNVTRIEKKSLK